MFVIARCNGICIICEKNNCIWLTKPQHCYEQLSLLVEKCFSRILGVVLEKFIVYHPFPATNRVTVLWVSVLLVDALHMILYEVYLLR